jgi:pheromone shutdown-related protein TraB
MAEVGHVSRVEYAGKELFIVGTAHVSKKSVEEVQRVIDEVRPDTVCVELDQARYDTLVNGAAWRKLDIFTVIKQKRVLFLMTSLALTAFQRKMGERLGVKPGAELLAAVEKANEVGAKVVLADRDVQATLKRTWASLSFWNKSQLAAGLLAVPFSVQEIEEAQIEDLKDKDNISEMLAQLAEQMPGLKEPLIDERDRYLMSMVQEAPGQRIVAVVGAGHVEGMLTHLGQSVDREALSRIPPKSKLTEALQWIIPTIILMAFYWGYRERSGEGLIEMLIAWILPTSIGSGLLTAVALGHPLTILTAVVAAPITTLNPAIGAGMVTGLVEAWLRRPTVADCEEVQDALHSLKAMYKNRVTRVLLVAIASTIGAAVGMWIATTWVLTLL